MPVHKCDALIVCCIDFRFQKYIRNWTDKNLKNKTFDLVGFAGATKDLDIVLKQLDISVKLHQIKQVVLIHHEECGAYGKASTLPKHIQDLNKAEQRILATYPQLQVDLYYLKLDGDFEKIE